MSHHVGLLHGDLLDSLEITDPIVEGINDNNIRHVWDSVPGIAYIFIVLLETLIMLLLDSLQGFWSGGMLVCAWEVPDELVI
jgi:hypothetical protein